MPITKRHVAGLQPESGLPLAASDCLGVLAGARRRRLGTGMKIPNSQRKPQIGSQREPQLLSKFECER